MRATCHVSSVQRRYCSGFLSLPHMVVIALWLGAAFLPLLLALGSRGAINILENDELYVTLSGRFCASCGLVQ
jgi:hypothetical protein